MQTKNKYGVKLSVRMENISQTEAIVESSNIVRFYVVLILMSCLPKTCLFDQVREKLRSRYMYMFRSKYISPSKYKNEWKFKHVCSCSCNETE